MNKKQILVLILVLLSGILYYQYTIPRFNTIETQIIRIIDGDTIETTYGKIRLLGINTPEKNQPYYKQAKDYLEQYKNKNITIKTNQQDQYNRHLAYVFYNNQLLNQELIKKGLAHTYYYEKDQYYNQLKKAEQQAQQNQKGIWQPSQNSNCIELIKLKYKENKRCTNQEELTLNNKCNTLNITIKDKATHIYEKQLETGIYTQNFSCIWNNQGDALFIYDNSGMILYYEY